MKELFSIGTIVTIKDMKDPVMIVGYLTKVNNKVYDYMGVPYPTGMVSSSSAIVFNHNTLDKLIAEGYKDEDSEKLLKALPRLVSGASVLNESREG